MEALLIVDVQIDFCPGGALEVPKGDKIIPIINQLSEQFDIVVQTQDWHPQEHTSFASTHDNQAPFETINMPYGQQVLWPDHCVQGSEGAQFHPDLNTKNSQLIVRKGFRKQIDSYSAFYENDGETTTGLTGYLKARDIDTLYAVGLATDFCVKWSVVDGIKEGFDLHVVEDAVKGIDIEGSVDQAWQEMLDQGATKVSSSELLD
ncbi:bifunctional nicotinamidase/pyrazinamidase [Fodinibius sp. Rm-B-1B1-1]|uniref:bifunctional nicotinamidase/pyrazinamidase n=1 Tax=Fodinibius alkaliphilus TaxID=3140241 RepID=UPI00315ADA32